MNKRLGEGVDLSVSEDATKGGSFEGVATASSMLSKVSSCLNDSATIISFTTIKTGKQPKAYPHCLYCIICDSCERCGVGRFGVTPCRCKRSFYSARGT